MGAAQALPRTQQGISGGRGVAGPSLEQEVLTGEGVTCLFLKGRSMNARLPFSCNPLTWQALVMHADGRCPRLRGCVARPLGWTSLGWNCLPLSEPWDLKQVTSYLVSVSAPEKPTLGAWGG